MRIRSYSFEELLQHSVSPAFARILTSPESYHQDLSICVGKTDWDYFIPDGVTDIVPLWDANADSYVRWSRDGKIEYVWLFHDDPNWSLTANSEQGVMAQLWQDWTEMQDSDEESRRFAAAIGFRYCEEGLAVWDNDYDALSGWRLGLKD